MGGGSKFQNLEKVQNLLKRLGVVNFYVEAMKTTWFKCPINVISLNYQVNNFTTKMLWKHKNRRNVEFTQILNSGSIQKKFSTKFEKSTSLSCLSTFALFTFVSSFVSAFLFC